MLSRYIPRRMSVSTTRHVIVLGESNCGKVRAHILHLPCPHLPAASRCCRANSCASCAAQPSSGSPPPHSALTRRCLVCILCMYALYRLASCSPSVPSPPNILLICLRSASSRSAAAAAPPSACGTLQPQVRSSSTAALPIAASFISNVTCSVVHRSSEGAAALHALCRVCVRLHQRQFL